MLENVKKHLKDVASAFMPASVQDQLFNEDLGEVLYALNKWATVATTDVEGTITYVNDNFCELTGFSRKELIGHNHRIMNSGYHPPDFFEDLYSVITKGRVWRGTIKNKKKNGDFFWVEAIIVPFKDDNGDIYRYITIKKDVTDSIRDEETMLTLVQNDIVTGLPNRTQFETLFKQAIIKAEYQIQPLALLLIDLDNFKFINDTAGYEAGNKILKLVAGRFKSLNAQFLGNLSADTFVVFIENVEEEAISFIADDIKKRLAEPLTVDHVDYYITASIGVSILPHSGNDLETLFKHAEMALHEAKDSGKNRYILSNPTITLQRYKEYTLRKDIGKALRDQEFSIYYQPVVDTRVKRIVGAEAIIHWDHHEWGVISPRDFLAIAEEAGVIHEIDEFLVKSVCYQINEWVAAKVPLLPISINLTSRQVCQGNIVTLLQEQIQEYNINPKLLELEITENSLLSQTDGAKDLTDCLQTLGVKISLDDFGTGYSSLSNLKNYPIEKIKLSKSFISDITTNKQSFEICKALMNLAESLQIEVVADGVETLGQLQMLQKLQCHFIQGHLFSKPLSVKQFSESVTNGLFISPTGFAKNADVSNKRKFFRIQLPFPLAADFTLLRIRNNNLSLGSNEVLVVDISAGGVCFYSTIQVPAHKELTVGIQTTILGEEIKLKGNIVWAEVCFDNIYRYGLHFIVDEKGHQHLCQLLNRFQINNKNNQAHLSNSRFILTSDIAGYLTGARLGQKIGG